MRASSPITLITIRQGKSSLTNNIDQSQELAEEISVRPPEDQNGFNVAHNISFLSLSMRMMLEVVIIMIIIIIIIMIITMIIMLTNYDV